MSEPKINVLLTQAQRKVVSDLLPELAARLMLDEKNSRTIPFPVKKLEAIGDKAEVARPNAENNGDPELLIGGKCKVEDLWPLPNHLDGGVGSRIR